MASNTLGAMASRTSVLLLVAFALSRSVVAGDPLSMKVVPMLAVAPATLRVRAEVAPEAQNRMRESERLWLAASPALRDHDAPHTGGVIQTTR